MKKFLYSNYTKFIAFIMCALSMAVCSYLVTTNFLGEDSIYLFESSYEESYIANNKLSDIWSSIYYRLENTIDDEGHLHPEEIRWFPSADEWEYYIRVNDKVYSNVQNQAYEDFEKSPLSRGIRSFAKTSEQEGFSNPPHHRYEFYLLISDDYEICVKMSNSLIDENSKVWFAEKYNADRAVKSIIALIVFAVAMLIYLLCVTGKKYGSDKIQMLLVDKLFVEITAAMFFGIFLGLGALTIFGAVYFIIDENIMLANQLAAVSIFAVVSLSMLLLLSLVRNLKNGTFLKRSLIVRICKFMWRAFKLFCRWIKKVLSQAKKTILIVSAKNFSGRFVGIMIVFFAAVVFILTALTFSNEAFAIFLIAFVAATVAFVGKRLIGFKMLKDGIEKIKDGDLNHKITDCPDGVIGQMAENINSVGEGLQKSLEREVKAERMKSELITNVSHDLKTPLTSIINYAQLLSKEMLAPYEANDYVKIILQKSERLKQLTNDLFDISKVQSGNEEFNIEDIDICLLINQAMAELNERIEKSGLVFKITSSDKEIFVKADGRKMSRVFENLFANCVKYAMPNTRVYIDISEKNDHTAVEIKNIAGYEMDFDETEITERFVRGDSSRSTEGSGLGLAIVKSYVEGCGGSVNIKKDGDLFKVIIHFMK